MEYRYLKLSAMQQFHVTRRLTPLMAAVAGTASENELFEKLAEGLSTLPDKDVNFVLGMLLSVVRRVDPQGLGLMPVIAAYTDGEPQLMFADITMPEMLKLAFASGKENLGSFFSEARALASSVGNQKQNAQ